MRDTRKLRGTIIAIVVVIALMAVGLVVAPWGTEAEFGGDMSIEQDETTIGKEN